MANGKQIIDAAGRFFIALATGKWDVCESCCAGVDNCNCLISDTDPRVKLTISWTEDEWQASTQYYASTIIKYTPDPVGDPSTYYLFMMQGSGTGTSGASAPSWDTTIGNTTSDNGITWIRIANDFARGYYGCTFTNGQTRELCPTTYGQSGPHILTPSNTLSGFYDTNANNENWQLVVGSFNTARFTNSFLWSNKVAIPSARHNHFFDFERIHKSTNTVGAVAVAAFVRIKFRGYWDTVYGNGFYTTLNSTSNLVSQTPTLNACKAAVSAKPLSVAITSTGVMNISFGSETDVCGVTFDWSRMAPSEATVGTPNNWQATAP